MKKINLACIIEDDRAHVYLTKKYLEMSNQVESIMVCRNGKEAYDKLKEIADSEKPLPELILLDLNMPIWDGWQFLDEFTKIRTDQTITLYILTSSVSPSDQKRAEKYKLRGNYLIKPVTANQLKDILARID